MIELEIVEADASPKIKQAIRALLSSGSYISKVYGVVFRYETDEQEDNENPRPLLRFNGTHSFVELQPIEGWEEVDV